MSICEHINKKIKDYLLHRKSKTILKHFEQDIKVHTPFDVKTAYDKGIWTISFTGPTEPISQPKDTNHLQS